jgi:hypothetical protein
MSFLNVFLIHKPFRAQGPRGITNPCFLSTLRGSWITNTFKKTKTKKVLKNFFSLSFLNVFLIHKPFRAQGPRGITNSCFLSTLRGSCFTNTFKKTKTKKVLKNFFFFVFFECVCESRTSGLKDLAESRTPVSSALSEVHVSQTHSKKQKRKKF